LLNDARNMIHANCPNSKCVEVMKCTMIKELESNTLQKIVAGEFNIS